MLEAQSCRDCQEKWWTTHGGRTDGQTHASTHAHTHTRARTHARTHTHAHAHTRTRTHTHIHTHARTHARPTVKSTKFLQETLMQATWYHSLQFELYDYMAVDKSSRFSATRSRVALASYILGMLGKGLILSFSV